MSMSMTIMGRAEGQIIEQVRRYLLAHASEKPKRFIYYFFLLLLFVGAEQSAWNRSDMKSKDLLNHATKTNNNVVGESPKIIAAECIVWCGVLAPVVRHNRHGWYPCACAGTGGHKRPQAQHQQHSKRSGSDQRNIRVKPTVAMPSD